MSDKTKYSSFKNQQTITESFRKYVNENSSESEIEEIIKELGLEGEEAKGYALALKHVGRYKFDQINRKGDRMEPPEWNEGWIQALNDVEKWSKSDKKQSLMNWLIDQQDPYDHYEDADDREFLDFQNSPDYKRSDGQSQQTMTENFRRFLKK